MLFLTPMKILLGRAPKPAICKTETLQQSKQKSFNLMKERRSEQTSPQDGTQATQLLYYEDAYLREFEGEVVGIQRIDDRYGVILDRTGFYPAGGGQPADTGIMKGKGGEIEVADVQRTGRQIFHITSEFRGEISEGEQVRGVINWDRRYALMRNHTAAHIMGEAVRRATGAPLEIVGSAIDVDKARLDCAYDKSLRPLFSKIEEISNTVVKENRIVEVKMMRRQEAEEYVERFNESLKTLPSQVQQVRIVEIEDWHVCACGGTHVKSTRELEFIKVLRRASKGKGVERLEFSARVLQHA